MIMKYSVLFVFVLLTSPFLFAQTEKKYPEPEFTNEVYFLKKDSFKVKRLEKSLSKMETKTKLAGFGGSESGYIIDGERSPIRLESGSNLSFVISTGSSVKQNNAAADSVMRANGMDPSMMNNQMESMHDPANTITLYKVEKAKGGKRKVLLQGIPGAFGKKKISSSDIYSFSVKKVREGYWELMIDKPLPAGEYAFSVMTQTQSMAMNMEKLFFAFGVN